MMEKGEITSSSLLEIRYYDRGGLRACSGDGTAEVLRMKMVSGARPFSRNRGARGCR